MTAAKDMITQAVRVVRKHADVAMKAAGHKSVAMHQRYMNLKPGDVAKAFGIIEDCSQCVPKDLPAKQASSASN
jgi:hypothetical protein